jgi:tRNA threonylcarbamoyladenosine biosynthesis protein TsaB
VRRILALESATEGLSVALLEGERVVVLREHAQARQHAAVLLAVVDETLREAGLTLGELDAMAITAGPGAFTSLRIGLATLKGLAFGRALPVVGVSTLETMALRGLEGAPDAGSDLAAGTEVLALLDARRGEWYAGAWRAASTPGEVPTSTLVEGLYAPAQLVNDLPRSVVALSPEAAGWREGFERAGLRFAACIEGSDARPRADWVGRLAARRLARGEGQPASTLTARYLRRAEAEARRMGSAVEEGETERIEGG